MLPGVLWEPLECPRVPEVEDSVQPGKEELVKIYQMLPKKVGFDINGNQNILADAWYYYIHSMDSIKLKDYGSIRSWDKIKGTRK